MVSKRKDRLKYRFLEKGWDRRKLGFTLALNREILKLSEYMFDGSLFPYFCSILIERSFLVRRCAVGHGRNSESMVMSGRLGIPSE